MDPENHWLVVLVEENTLPGGNCQGLLLVFGSVSIVDP